jgi:hypothetical protein
MFSKRLNVLSAPTMGREICKQNSGCADSAFICRLRDAGFWYVAPPFSVVVSRPGGECTGDITATDPESGLILPDEEDIVAAFASSDSRNEVLVSCILKH